MAGVSKLDKPLTVKLASQFLKDPDALLVVLDEVVVGGEDLGYPALGWERELSCWDTIDSLSSGLQNRCSRKY